MLKTKWVAQFKDGTKLEQPENDRYSKHKAGASHNPSAFRDVLDKNKQSPLVLFKVYKGNKPILVVDMVAQTINGAKVKERVLWAKIIYYRTYSAEIVGSSPTTPRLASVSAGFEGFINGKKVKYIKTEKL